MKAASKHYLLSESWWAHLELLLVALLSSSDPSERRFAVCDRRELSPVRKRQYVRPAGHPLGHFHQYAKGQNVYKADLNISLTIKAKKVLRQPLDRTAKTLSDLLLQN